MHLVLEPVAIVGSAVRPLVEALALDHVVCKGALVGGAVGPLEEALANLLTFFVLSIVDRAVEPALLSVALLHIFHP